MIRSVIPLLHVSNSSAAEDFYCKRLGFQREFAHRADQAKPDPCYTSVVRDDARLHLSSFFGDGVSGAVVNLVVDSIDTLFEEFTAKHISIAVGPVDQAWGTREMYIKDPDGNCLHFMENRTTM
jgi:uncharacterized glyoxalase superfamily protein PhnB